MTGEGHRSAVAGKGIKHEHQFAGVIVNGLTGEPMAVRCERCRQRWVIEAKKSRDKALESAFRAGLTKPR